MKKRTKKLHTLESVRGETPANKVSLLLFVHKKKTFPKTALTTRRAALAAAGMLAMPAILHAPILHAPILHVQGGPLRIAMVTTL
ncbi:MAG: hypothetical protein J0H91_01665, partial [Rhodospirillales bacterium]|nr:hypothetical protein [Rhodospirillales bacterium]